MATSPSRRNRHRRRKAGVLVACGATAALLASGLPVAPADADVLEDLGAVLTCEAGSGVSTKTPDRDVTAPLIPDTGWVEGQVGSVDCQDSDASIVAQVGDAILGLVLPDLPIGLASFNRAVIVPNPASLTPTVWGHSFFAPTNATIGGNGYTFALAAISADATADARNYLSGAIALAATGGTANANANIFGAALATAIGANVIEIPGIPGVKPSATADALPAGVAITIVALNGDQARSKALGGIAMATSNPLDVLATPETGGAQAVCTAVYAEASVQSQNGDNKSSCTGVLFIFQQYQKGADGPIWYAIKNPFDVNLLSPMSATLTGGISTVLQLLGLPEIAADALSGQFVPEFGSDIIRISFDGGTPQIETDLPQWLQGLGNSTSANTLLASNSLTAASAAADAPTVLASNVDESVRKAPMEINEPAALPAAEVGPAAPPAEITYKEPTFTEPEVSTPAAPELTVNEPAVTEPVQEAPAAGTTGEDATGDDSTEDDSTESVDSAESLVVN